MYSASVSGSGLAFALLTVANRRNGSSMNAMHVAFWQNVVVAALVAPFAVAHLGNTSLGGSDGVNLALLGGCPSSCSSRAWKGCKRVRRA